MGESKVMPCRVEAEGAAVNEGTPNLENAGSRVGAFESAIGRLKDELQS
jgi:hypothetical protein